MPFSSIILERRKSMCLIRLLKFLLKVVLPLAIIGLVVYLVYFSVSGADDTTTEAMFKLGALYKL